MSTSPDNKWLNKFASGNLGHFLKVCINKGYSLITTAVNTIDQRALTQLSGLSP